MITTKERSDEAKPLFEKAIVLFPMENNRGRNFAGDTYERWGDAQREWGHPDAADGLYKNALDAYSKIDNPTTKARAVAKVQEKIDQTQSPSSTLLR